jgi:hypothetical protein
MILVGTEYTADPIGILRSGQRRINESELR